MTPQARASDISILSMDHGLFPEIAPLNPALSATRDKLKITLDISDDLAGRLVQADRSFRSRLLDVCPTLNRHACRGDNGVTPLDPDVLGEICGLKRADDPVDVAHLLEHMVIDLVVEISGISRCSGVTCGLHEPTNRFHVYVECEDDSVGRIAVQVAVEALIKLLEAKEGPERFRRQVVMAQWVVGRNGNTYTATEAATALGWTVPETRETVGELVIRGFLNRETPPINFSGLIYFRRSGPRV